MKFVLLFSVLVILVNSDNVNINIDKDDGNVLQKVLLRKLQNLEQNNVKSVTWNEILADVLVNKITSNKNSEEHNENILTKCFSDILWVYKTYVYDKFCHTTRKIDALETNKEKEVETKRDVEKEEIPPIVYIGKTNGPKSEIEIIEPAYHGKIEKETDKPSTDENKTNADKNKPVENIQDNFGNTKCPDGYVKVDNGRCMDPKTSRFILFIPNQCPLGYIKDRLGYCREIF